MSLQQRIGNWTKDDEVRTGLGEWNSDVIYIQMKVEKETYRTFYVGTTEENLQPVGQMVEATPGRWVGVKDGLFAILYIRNCRKYHLPYLQCNDNVLFWQMLM